MVTTILRKMVDPCDFGGVIFNIFLNLRKLIIDLDGLHNKENLFPIALVILSKMDSQKT